MNRLFRLFPVLETAATRVRTISSHARLQSEASKDLPKAVAGALESKAQIATELTNFEEQLSFLVSIQITAAEKIKSHTRKTDIELSQKLRDIVRLKSEIEVLEKGSNYHNDNSAKTGELQVELDRITAGSMILQRERDEKKQKLLAAYDGCNQETLKVRAELQQWMEAAGVAVTAAMMRMAGVHG